jgi:hypothetical protein
VSKLPGAVPQRGSGTSADRASCLGFCDRLRCSAPPRSRLISVRSAVRIGPGPSVKQGSATVYVAGPLLFSQTATKTVTGALLVFRGKFEFRFTANGLGFPHNWCVSARGKPLDSGVHAFVIHRTQHPPSAALPQRSAASRRIDASCTPASKIFHGGCVDRHGKPVGGSSTENCAVGCSGSLSAHHFRKADRAKIWRGNSARDVRSAAGADRGARDRSGVVRLHYSTVGR